MFNGLNTELLPCKTIFQLHEEVIDTQIAAKESRPATISIAEL